MTQQAPATKPKAVADLIREIVIEAGIEGMEVPGLHKAVWFNGPWTTSDQEGTVIRHGEKFALNPALVVFRIFEDDTEIRVYALALSDGKSEGEPVHPSCYHLQKTARVYTAHSMSLGLFRDEVAGELRALVEGMNEPGYDEVTCPACSVEVPELPFCGSCGVKLPETPDGDAPATTNGAVATTTPAVTP